MSELTDDRLLPCPFCGHEAVHQNHSARPGEYWYANSFIRCPNCKASGPIGSQDEAVTAWNRRAAASTSTEGAGVKATHQHVKRGTEYVLIGYGEMQADPNDWVALRAPNSGEWGLGPWPIDMRKVAIYRSMNNGALWVRPVEEFEDGRFIALNPPAPKVTTDEAEERG